MPILTPNSYGTVSGTRVREYNPYHQPAGTPIGGQFAPRPSGASNTRKVAEAVLREWSDDVVKSVFGRELSPVRIQALAEEMVSDTDGLTFKVKVSAALYQSDDRSGKLKPTVILTWIGNDGNADAQDEHDRPTSFVRAFYRDERGNLVVKHSSFEKNRAQPAGLGRDVLRSHVRTYERLGVDRIETYANIDVGAYAWAKYGFAAWDAGQVQTMLEDVIAGAEGTTVYDRDFLTGQPKGRGVGLGEREATMLRRIAASSNKTAIWEFADATIEGVKVGKALLTASDGWDAYFKVKDDGSPMVRRMHERFWSYVGRTKGSTKREAQPPLGPGLSGLLDMRELGEREVASQAKPGELCEWNGSRYVDGAIWADLLDGDRRFFYNLGSPSERAAYQALLPKG